MLLLGASGDGRALLGTLCLQNHKTEAAHLRRQDLLLPEWCRDLGHTLPGHQTHAASGSWRRLHLDGGSWTGWSAGRAYETGIPHAQTSPGGSRGQTWAPPTFILPSENHRRQRLPTVVLIYSRRAGHSRTPSQEVGMISSGEGPCLWRKRILCPHVSHSPCTPLWCLSLASTSRKGSHLSSL